ncbi:MAG: alpha/beta hydrolase [Chlamydiota bacterium]
MNENNAYVFNAKWHQAIFPYRIRNKRLKQLGSALFFPLFFLLRIGRAICRRKLLPASSYRKKEARTTAAIFLRRWSVEGENSLRKNFDVYNILLHTPDGAAISGVYYAHKEKTPDTPVVLLFQPNGSLVKHGEYEWLLASCQERNIVANFVTIDYRGCGESSGRARKASDLILDGDTLYQYVRTCLQSDPARIVFYGHSLGASVAAFVKSLYPNQPIKYVNERSFASITQLFSLRYPRMGGVFSWIMRSLDWELDVSDQWSSLRGEKLVLFQKNDAIIPYRASLHYFLQAKSRKSTSYVELTPYTSLSSAAFHHSLPLKNYIDKHTSLCAEKRVLDFLFDFSSEKKAKEESRSSAGEKSLLNG